MAQPTTAESAPENPDKEAPDPFESTWERERRTKRWILAITGIYAVGLGVIGGLDPGGEDRLSDLILGAVGLGLGVAWCLADARQRGRPMGLLLRVALVLAFVIVLPVYLLRSRGLLRGIGALFLVAAWLIALGAIAIVSGELVQLARAALGAR